MNKPITTRSLIMRDDGPALEVVRENARSYIVCFWDDEPGHGKFRLIHPRTNRQFAVTGVWAWRRVQRIQEDFLAGYKPS